MRASPAIGRSLAAVRPSFGSAPAASPGLRRGLSSGSTSDVDYYKSVKAAADKVPILTSFRFHSPRDSHAQAAATQTLSGLKSHPCRLHSDLRPKLLSRLLLSSFLPRLLLSDISSLSRAMPMPSSTSGCATSPAEAVTWSALNPPPHFLVSTQADR